MMTNAMRMLFESNLIVFKKGGGIVAKTAESAQNATKKAQKYKKGEKNSTHIQ